MEGGEELKPPSPPASTRLAKDGEIFRGFVLLLLSVLWS